MKKIALFFGGLSNENEISVLSARNVVKYFDYRRYKLELIYWHKKDRKFYLLKNLDQSLNNLKKSIKIEEFAALFDVALLMTHGRHGEDGELQAILESQKIKYCGSRVLSSSVCMDKAIFKDLMSAHDVRQVKYLSFDYRKETDRERQIKLRQIEKEFKFPLYIKPANSGSSIGISRVDKKSGLRNAIRLALKHDDKILIEEGLVNPREVEIAVVGNKKLMVSRPGELKLTKDFYDFNDKYKVGEAKIAIPAKIGTRQAREIRLIAAQAYRLADCQGFARIDFFISRGRIYLNEINTLPGFTDISMFPLLMIDQGLSYKKLLETIIELAY